MASKRTLRRQPPAPKNGSKTRTLKRTSGAKELAQIERMLGEDFDSLAQARRALKKESTPVAKPAPKKSIPKRITPAPTPQQESTPKTKPYPFASNQHAYLVRELRKGEKQEIIQWLTDYNATRRVQSLRKPGEFWAAEIPYRVNDKKTGVNTQGVAKTYNIYSDIYGLFAQLSGYARSKKQSRETKLTTTRWLNSIKVVRFKGSDPNYKHHQPQKQKKGKGKRQ